MVAAEVEVLIVSFDSATVLERCMATLATVAPAVRIAVREHGDTAAFERLRHVCRKSMAEVRCDHDPTNPGFGAGCNALAASSAAEFLVFLNPDTETISWPWATRRPERGAVVGASITGPGKPPHHYGISYRLRDEIARSWFRRRASLPHGVGFVSGAAMLIDAETFRSLGGFDEGYFLFYEDIDLCLRANAAGIITTIAPSWSVRHAGAHSTRGVFADSLTWSYESACRFHGSQGTAAKAHSTYVLVDSVARWLRHAVLRNRPAAAAYRGLARRALVDTLRSPPSDPRRSVADRT